MNNCMIESFNIEQNDTDSGLRNNGDTSEGKNNHEYHTMGKYFLAIVLIVMTVTVQKWRNMEVMMMRKKIG